MCTECYTRCIRRLVEITEYDWHYTLRIGEALMDASPVIICGPQSEIAGFDFYVADEYDLPSKIATPESDPSRIRAFLRVIDPADWARFLLHYAAKLQRSDFETIVDELGAEASALYREAVEYARANPVCPESDDE